MSFVAGSSTWSVTIRAERFQVALDMIRHDVMTQLIKPRSNVVFGETVLNRRYFAEATPSELVSSVFAGELERRIGRQRPARLAVKPGELKLTEPYRYYGVHDATIRDNVELIIDLAQALEKACKCEPVADREARLYRDDSNMGATETALVKRSTDVAAALERQKRRDVHVVRVEKLAITAAAIFLVLFSILVAIAS